MHSSKITDADYERIRNVQKAKAEKLEALKKECEEIYLQKLISKLS